MGWRFRRTVRLFPGLSLNFSNSGISTSIGPRGAKINLGKRGTRATFGIPGTGLSYSSLLSGRRANASGNLAGEPFRLWSLWWLIPVFFVLGAASKCSSSSSPVTPPPAPETTTNYVTASALNCRTAESADAPVLRRLSRADAVQVVQSTGEWSQVQDEPKCWVSSRYLSATMPLSDQPSDVTAGPMSKSTLGLATLATSSTMKAKAMSHNSRSRKSKRSRARPTFYEQGGSCPCSGYRVCVGPRGGRYCITRGRNKRYGI